MVVKQLVKKVVNVFSSFAIGVSRITFNEANNVLTKTSPLPIGSCFVTNRNIIDSQFDLQIIIPAYNVEQYISSCLDSVVANMKNSKYRIIATIVNDGSTDGSRDVIYSFVDRFSDTSVLNRGGYEQRIEIINQENKGFSGARNAGLNSIKAKYITFLDSDDLLAKGGIDALLDAAFLNDLDIVQGAWTEIDTEQNVVNRKYPKHLSGFPWGKVYKASVLRNFQFPEGYWFEDTPLSFFLYYTKRPNGSALKTSVINNFVYNYRINPKGITATSGYSMKCVDSYYITELCLKEFPAFGVDYDCRAYEYFLNQCITNWWRTKNLNRNVREAIFVKECDLKEKYFSKMHCHDNLLCIEKAMINRRFKQFELLCWSTR